MLDSTDSLTRVPRRESQDTFQEQLDDLSDRLTFLEQTVRTLIWEFVITTLLLCVMCLMILFYLPEVNERLWYLEAREHAHLREFTPERDIHLRTD